MHSRTSGSSGKDAQTLYGSAHSAAKMLFSHSHHPPPEPLGEGHQTETPDGGQTYLPQTPGDMLSSGCLGAAWNLPRGGTGGHSKDGPATPPAFDRTIFAGLPVTRRMEVLRAQSAPLNAPSLYLPPLSNMSSLLSRPVMTELYLNIYRKTGMSIKVGSSKSALKVSYLTYGQTVMSHCVHQAAEQHWKWKISLLHCQTYEDGAYQSTR